MNYEKRLETGVCHTKGTENQQSAGILTRFSYKVGRIII